MWTDRVAGQVAYRGDLPAPVTTYADSQSKTPLISQNKVPPSTNRTNAAVVQRKPRRNGLLYFYSHGSTHMRVPNIPSPGNGGVLSSAFQPILTTLHDWSQNLAWFAAGYPRNLGYVTRVPQLSTKATGGPTDSSMQAKPRFDRVQSVRRYSVVPRAYPTKSSNG